MLHEHNGAWFGTSAVTNN